MSTISRSPGSGEPRARLEMTLHDERSGSGNCPRTRTQDATSAVFDEHAPRWAPPNEPGKRKLRTTRFSAKCAGLKACEGAPLHGAEVPQASSRWIVEIGDVGPPTPS